MILVLQTITRSCDSHDHDRIARIERNLMDAEYLLDSTNGHTIKKGCGDVRPISLSRYLRATGRVRGALRMIRNEQGFTQWTLFAGSGGPDAGSWGRQKPWRHNVAHRWTKDCETMVLDPEIEKGLEAECWHCDEIFVKEIPCENCGFYKCPSCDGCACQLDETMRKILEKTVRAMSGRAKEA